MLHACQSSSIPARATVARRARFLALAGAAIVTLTSSFASAVLFPVGYTHQIQVRGNLAANPGPSFNVPHGTTFSSTTVALNNSGVVATKISTIGLTSNQGIWSGPGNGTGGIVATGPDIDTALWSDVSIGNTGRIILPVSSSASDGLYRRDTVDAPGVTFMTKQPLGSTSWSGVRVANNNNVGYKAGFSGDSAIVRYNPTTNTNTVYASQSGNNYGFIFTPWMNNNEQFVSRVTNNNVPTTNDDQVRKFNADGSSSLVVQEGQVISGWGTVTGIFLNASMNDSGEVAVILQRSAGGSTLFKISADGNTFTQIATANASNPVGGVRSFPGFTPIINNNGLVAFRAQDVNLSDPTSHDVVMVGDGTNLIKVIGERDSVLTDLGPGQIGQETLGSPAFAGNIAFNDSNQVAYTAGVYPLGDDQTEWGTAVFLATAIVPEPATIGLAFSALTIGLLRRRAR